MAMRTARQKAALRKAQLASARKRRGKGKGKLAAANRRASRNKTIALAAGGLAGAASLYGYGSNRSLKKQKYMTNYWRTAAMDRTRRANRARM